MIPDNGDTIYVVDKRRNVYVGGTVIQKTVVYAGVGNVDAEMTFVTLDTAEGPLDFDLGRTTFYVAKTDAEDAFIGHMKERLPELEISKKSRLIKE